MIKPIQRIQKYHLLVKKILAYSESGGAGSVALAALRDAVLCTSIIPKNANDMMDVGRLQGFTVLHYAAVHRSITHLILIAVSAMA